MHWTDPSIILSTRKYGENSAIIRVLSRSHGVYGGVMRGVHSKANRGIIQPGNIVDATWNARLSEQLGSLKCELQKANAAHIMQDSGKLAALTSACALIESALPERHPYPRLYLLFQDFLDLLLHEAPWEEAYVKLEMELLADTGFGLDLTSCAATEVTEDLIYVSPKSGRAVCREAGEPYKDKLLPLPGFLLKALPLEGGGLGGGDLTLRSRDLRKNQTEAEKTLWHYLNHKQLEGYRFRRQHPMGNRYIVDFICLEQRLIIELDGGQHAEQQSYDAQRTKFLEAEGYRVLRFWNNEVMGNIDGVWMQIKSSLATPPPQPSPLKGEGVLESSPPSRGRALRTQEILAGLRLTGYFLATWLLTPHNRKLPAARDRLIQTLQKVKELHAAEA